MPVTGHHFSLFPLLVVFTIITSVSNASISVDQEEALIKLNEVVATSKEFIYDRTMAEYELHVLSSYLDLRLKLAHERTKEFEQWKEEHEQAREKMIEEFEKKEKKLISDLETEIEEAKVCPSL